MERALRLANAWQRGFPLAPRPFAEIAWRNNSSEEEVLDDFIRLKDLGVLHRIGPVFRPNTLGASTLAAIAVPQADLARVAAIVSAEAGVNHNYEREHRVNLWFVVTAPDETAVEATLTRIEEAAGLPALRLPLLEEFHIDLGFDVETRAAPRESRRADAASLKDEQRAILRALGAGLTLVPRAYALCNGSSEESVIDALRAGLDAGVVRRVGTVLRHRRLGYRANAMAVWDVPDERARELGRRLGADRAVTLCYRRARAPAWPYSFYCMVHGRERARVLDEVERLSVLHGLGSFPRAVLFSRRCFSQRAACYG
ncbi:MAG TPA: Lrp/AsnC family transcriptional regulator [Burkholderiales bacterium]|nr:Lrp/AsnC family transcriptional regulator [Burkholderiales bacterium]